MHLTIEEIAALAKAGGLAASGGNAQPWQLSVRHNILEIRLNPHFLNTKGMPYTYIVGGIFSLGMFAENICIRSESLGLSYHLTLFDQTELDKPFAIFEYTNRNKNDISHLKSSSLLSTLENRATNRKLHDGTEIPQAQIDSLSKKIIPTESLCKLSFVKTKKQRKKIVDILSTSEAIRLKNTILFESMMDEIRWNSEKVRESQDGIDIDTLELSKMDNFILHFLRKHHFLTKIVPDIALKGLTKKYMMSAAYIGCMGIGAEISYKHLLIAGQTSQRLWLAANELNIAFHPWTSLPFMALDALNPQSSFNKKEKHRISLLYQDLCEQFSRGEKIFPIFIFRLFKAPPPAVKALRKDWKSYTVLAENEII